MTNEDSDIILNFWFEQTEPPQWFQKNAQFDAEITQKFSHLVKQALAKELDKWAELSESCLALILLLDQMPRNIYRDTPMAFAGDKMACKLSILAYERGFITDEAKTEWRQIFLMPMMHSEDIAVQKNALPLFKTHCSARTYESACQHHDIIARFGRFPHRNKILGRITTPEEEEFLTQPNSSF